MYLILNDINDGFGNRAQLQTDLLNQIPVTQKKNLMM